MIRVASLAALSLVLLACSADVEPEPAPEMPADEPGAVTPPLPELPDFAMGVAARGNEPFWGVEVRGDEAILRTPELLEGRTFHSPTWERTGEGAWRLTLERAHADGVEFLTLEIVERECRDTMADERFPLTSAIRYGELVGPGCAEPVR